ncbi:MAG TPA: toll/interleukin-1 receptor domain-containing protein [Thermoanaerobaculia bacterium]|nr:toll/interleukin-1 receptor domain-containing protein [Thermoanaerobaculia bacterium]
MRLEEAKKWDVFISYAWEDKHEVARPLAHLLDRAGLRVWFDEFALQVGDSLVETIGRGLGQARYGVVILSRAFMAKKWPRNELSALFALEGPERGAILPVWHNVASGEVVEFNALLADRFALNTRDGLHEVAGAILSKLGRWERAPEAGPIEGRWRGESGRLLLRAAGDRIVGDYDWYGEKWVGRLEGTFSDGVLRYDWSWALDPQVGRGFFLDTIRETRGGELRSLRGAWWYATDEIDEAALVRRWQSHARRDRLLELGPDREREHPWSFVVPKFPDWAFE